ncbi:MAG TPA: hypothetical protein VG994_01450 [Steroidobacteraceae bacterium]|nr:hypothetical protein [Steroidobacteraceae bacterium]
MTPPQRASSAAPPATPAASGAPKRVARITPAGVFAVLAIVALYVGWRFPTERYITPERGIGYALGIVGGSMMLLLFLYSARKRFRWLSFLGGVARWFRFHMVLGILGPLCILYHSNFSLGAANSNVALFSMLTVAGSGLAGRYIYSRIHLGLYGRKTNLEELRAGADGLRALSGTVSFLPELVTRLDSAERRLLATGPHLPVLGFAKPIFVALNAMVSRWRLRSYVRSALRTAARSSPTIAAQKSRLGKAAADYIDRRLVATRRVAEFQAYERLFSLWHALHLPLIFMLIVAAVVHIVAVHVY